MNPDRVGDRYRLVRALGRGGSGEVYLAIDETDGSEVALKILDVTQHHPERVRRRLVREVRATQALDPARVARAIAVGETETGAPFLVMPFVAGATLRERLQRSSILAGEALRIVREIALTLDAAHAAGLVHRDIKPDNVILADDGRVVLLDFGIVKALDDSRDPSESALASTQLTGGGALVGTLAYIAPEQALGHAVDGRSDQFSLAVTAFELLTGNVPWLGDTPARILAQILGDHVPRASTRRDALPRAVDDVLIRALDKHASSRFASCGQFADALSNAVLHGVVAPTTEASPTASTLDSATTDDAVPPTRKVSRVALGMTTVVAALVLTMAGIALSRAPSTRGIAMTSSGPRPTIVVPLATSDEGAPCPTWMHGVLSEGLGAQLAAGGRLRVLGPRDLGGARVDAEAMRRVFGADAIVHAICSRTSSGDDVRVHLRVVTSAEDAHEIASVDVQGAANAPTNLVTRVADLLRAKLGVPAVEAVDRLRAQASMPESSDAARSYVEGLEKLAAFDAVAARRALEQTIAAEPSFAPAHAALAETFAYLQDQRAATHEAELAASTAPALPREEALLVEANAAAARRDWPKALETYRALFTVFPDRSDVALRLARTYVDAGDPKNARAMVDALLTSSGGEGDPRVLLEAARVRSMQGEDVAASDLATRAAALAESLAMAQVQAHARLVECRARMKLSDRTGSETACMQAETLFASVGDRMDVVRAQSVRAYLLTKRGAFEEAEALGRASLEAGQQAGSADAQAQALDRLATVAKTRGMLDVALERARGAVAHATGGSSVTFLHCRLTLAGILLDSGAVDAGRTEYDAVVALAEEAGVYTEAAIAHANLGIYWLRAGDVTKARNEATRALAMHERAGNEFDKAWALDAVGLTELESDAPAEAKAHFEEALALRLKMNLPGGSSRQNLAESQMALGVLDEALANATGATEEFRDRKQRTGECYARTVLARVLLARGEIARALSEAEEAHALAGENPVRVGSVVSVRARALFLAGRRADAFAALSPSGVHLEDDAARDARLVRDEMLLRSKRSARAITDLRALAAETRAGGNLRVAHAAEALLAGKLDAGYR